MVTIWTASTDEALALMGDEVRLDAEEMAQAGRLQKAGDRNRFLGARALLRHALSEALDGEVAPGRWRYREGTHGKPVMAPGLPPLEFNLSHAGDCVIACVSQAGAIGVDVEIIAAAEHAGIVEDALTGPESDNLNRLPDDRKRAAFLQLWTIKEACAKALGLGVTLDFRELEVTLEPFRVRTPHGLLGHGEAFHIESRQVVIAGNPYRLAVATITKAASRASFCFKAPDTPRMAQAPAISKSGNPQDESS